RNRKKLSERSEIPLHPGRRQGRQTPDRVGGGMRSLRRLRGADRRDQLFSRIRLRSFVGERADYFRQFRRGDYGVQEGQAEKDHGAEQQHGLRERLGLSDAGGASDVLPAAVQYLWVSKTGLRVFRQGGVRAI